MHPVSCTDTHHDVKDLVSHEMIKNTKTRMKNRKQNLFFLWNKKILNLCLRWHIFRSYRFLAEVTFKICEYWTIMCFCLYQRNGIPILCSKKWFWKFHVKKESPLPKKSHFSQTPIYFDPRVNRSLTRFSP